MILDKRTAERARKAQVCGIQHKIDVLRKEAGGFYQSNSTTAKQKLFPEQSDNGDAGLKLPGYKSRAGKLQQENLCSFTCEEQIKHYKDIISEIEYDRKDALALDQTLYQIRRDMGDVTLGDASHTYYTTQYKSKDTQAEDKIAYHRVNA